MNFRNASKKWAEQSTAVVALRALGRDDGLKEMPPTTNSGESHDIKEEKMKSTCTNANCDKTVLSESVKDGAEDRPQRTLSEKCLSVATIDMLVSKNSENIVKDNTS